MPSEADRYRDYYSPQKREEIYSRLMQELDRKPPPAPQFPSMYTPEYIERNYNRMGNERRLGQAVLATGNQGLHPLGQTLAASDPSRYLDDIGRQEQVRRYQQWQADQAARRPNQAAVLQRTLEMMQPELVSPAFNATSGDRNAIIDLRKTIMAGNAGLEDFKDSYSQIELFSLGGWDQNIPWARQIANKMAGMGMGNKHMKEAQQWWAAWDRLYNLPERNEMFGATLTKPEKEAWAQANINPDMDPDQIRENIRTILGIMEGKWTEVQDTFQHSNLRGMGILDDLDTSKPSRGVDPTKLRGTSSTFSLGKGLTFEVIE